jgi:phage/plasmid-associated DNA primase
MVQKMQKLQKLQEPKFEITVYKINKYSESDDEFIKECGIKYTEMNLLIQVLHKDEGYHFRIHNNNQYIFFGDIDKYTKTIEEFINHLQNFLKEYYDIEFNIDDFKYTANNKIDGSYHYSIPKFNASTEKLKQIHESFNKIHKKITDTTIYSEHWFRCPNQKKGISNDTTKHVIVKGDNIDFIVEYIPEYSININNYKNLKEERIVKRNKIVIIDDNENKQNNLEIMTNNNKTVIEKDGHTENELMEYNYNKSLVLSNTIGQPNTIKKVIDCYNNDRYDEYGCWHSVGMALRNTFGEEVAFELFDYLSSKGKKYGGTEETYKKFSSFKSFGFFKTTQNKNKNGYSIATIYYFAIEDNKPKFVEIMKKNTFELEQFDMCLYIKLLAENRFFYIKEGDLFKLYCFNGKYWVNDDTLLKQFISTELYDFLKLMVVELYFESQNFNKMISQIKKLKTAKFKQEMVTTYKEINLKPNMKFDNKWHLLGFNNQVYDLEKGEFRDYEYNDYVSITTGHDWREPTKDEVDLINKLLKQIMPNNEERELYLEILSTTMSGKCVERFFIFNGKGGNGKGMIDDLLLNALGNYAMIGNNSILFETNKTGSNPEKSNIHKKRCVIFREPPETKKFENSVIKELTGGGTFSARGHHEMNTTKELNLTMILEANKRPLFAEEPTEADTRRIIDIYFGTKYTTEKDLINENNNIYLANEYYKTDEFRTKYRYALLKILMGTYKKYKENNYMFKIPESIKDRTTQYLEMSCNILQWFKENYKHTGEKKDICKMRDLYDDFSAGTYFVNLTKFEKRKYNKSYFSDYISNNSIIGKYHRETHNNIRNCLIEWTRIFDNELEDDLDTK